MIDYAMRGGVKTKLLRIKPFTDIQEACEKAVEEARKRHCVVRFEFNGVMLCATQHSTPHAIYMYYMNASGSDRDWNFDEDLRVLISRYGIDKSTNMPDSAIAQYIANALDALDRAAMAKGA